MRALSIKRAQYYVICSFCAERALILLASLHHEVLLRQEFWDSVLFISLLLPLWKTVVPLLLRILRDKVPT